MPDGIIQGLRCFAVCCTGLLYFEAACPVDCVLGTESHPTMPLFVRSTRSRRTRRNKVRRLDGLEAVQHYMWHRSPQSALAWDFYLKDCQHPQSGMQCRLGLVVMPPSIDLLPGTQHRSREVQSPAENGGLPCQGRFLRMPSCHERHLKP